MHTYNSNLQQAYTCAARCTIIMVVIDDSPGALLKKDGHVVWTPIAARTRSRSRVYFKDNYTN